MTTTLRAKLSYTISTPAFWRAFIATAILCAIAEHITNFSFPVVVSDGCWLAAICFLYMFAPNLERADKLCWLVFAPALVVAVWAHGVVSEIALFVAGAGLLCWCVHVFFLMHHSRNENVSGQQHFDEMKARLAQFESYKKERNATND